MFCFLVCCYIYRSLEVVPPVRRPRRGRVGRGGRLILCDERQRNSPHPPGYPRRNSLDLYNFRRAANVDHGGYEQVYAVNLERKAPATQEDAV